MQLDNWEWNLNAWDKMVEKAINIEAKASLQPPSGPRKIDSRCLKEYKPAVKKDENDTYWGHRNEASNKDKEKAKFHNPSSFTNQP